MNFRFNDHDDRKAEQATRQKPRESETFEKDEEADESHQVKQFRKQFNVRLLNREQLSAEDVAVDYIELMEIANDETDLDEVEDKNWFDEENMYLENTAGVIRSLNELPTTLGINRQTTNKHRRTNSNETILTEVISELTVAVKSRDEDSADAFKIEGRRQLQRHRGSGQVYLLLAAAFLFATIFGLLIYKVDYERQRHVSSIAWMNHFRHLHANEVDLHSMLEATLLVDCKASGYLLQDFRQSTLADYLAALNRSTNAFYQVMISILRFEAANDIDSSTIGVDVAVQDLAGRSIVERDSLQAVKRSMMSASILLVDFNDGATGKNLRDERIDRGPGLLQSGTPIDRFYQVECLQRRPSQDE